MCADNKTCLDLSKVCNSKQDCVDGSDEQGACLTQKCSAGSCPSDADCVVLPLSGPTCVCRKGYVYNTTNRLCEVWKQKRKSVK